MKLALVRHVRCGEPDYDYGTYVWVHSGMTQPEFDGLIREAQDSYLKAEEALRCLHGPPDPGPRPNFTAYPNMAVSEVQRLYVRLKATWDEFDRTRRKARKPFADHLVDVTNGAVKSFYTLDPLLVGEADWGHRHGTIIEYGPPPLVKREV